MTTYRVGKEHPLFGIGLKIKRAEESLSNLDTEINKFLHNDPRPYRVIGGMDLDSTKYIFKGYGSPPPIRFSILAGEIIHQLRSCFDHMVVALVDYNKGDATNTNLGLPVCGHANSFKDAIGKGKIKGVSKSAATLIESIQPYNSSSPNEHILMAIHKFDIIDKHRLLILFVASTKISENITFKQSELATHFIGPLQRIEVSFSPPDSIIDTEKGSEIFSFTYNQSIPQFYTEADFIFNIAFEKIGMRGFMPVTSTLKMMIDYTRSFMGSFVKEFN